MGATNTEYYTEQQNRIAIICKALGHPARIAIIQHLIKVRQCICNDIVDELPLSQPTVSQHLKELKNAGLIKGTVEGSSICYCINEVTWNEYTDLFQSFFKSCTSISSCC